MALHRGIYKTLPARKQSSVITAFELQCARICSLIMVAYRGKLAWSGTTEQFMWFDMTIQVRRLTRITVNPSYSRRRAVFA
jgi:hypothetical protein